MVSSPVNVAEARSGSNFKSYDSGTTLSGSLCARIPELANKTHSANTTTRFINFPLEFAARARGTQLRRRTRPRIFSFFVHEKLHHSFSAESMSCGVRG